MNVTFVTGNPGKAKYFSEIIGFDVEYHDADTDEIQDMELAVIAEFKARQAYEQLQRPVIVEDTSLAIDFLKGLPGPFIKWFELSIGLEGICRLADGDLKRLARAENVHVYYDGSQTKVFKGGFDGTISDIPKGSTGFGFNPIFIPEGEQKTMAEMSEEEFKRVYLKIKPIIEVKEFLSSLDTAKA